MPELQWGPHNHAARMLTDTLSGSGYNNYFTVITTCYLKNGVHIFQAHYLQCRQCSYAFAQMCWHKANHCKYHCMVKNYFSLHFIKYFLSKNV